MNRFPPRRILVAADLSGPSLSALAAAKALALRWGAALEIVHVQHPPVLTAWAGPEGLPAAVPPAAQEPRVKVEERLRRAAAGFPAGRLKLRTLHGWPPAALADLARPERADLLVMGTHGFCGLDRLLAGSASETIIRRAGIPVLVVPEKRSVSGGGRVLAPWNGKPYATRALRWARELARGLGSTLDVLYVDEGGKPVESDAALCRRLLAALGTGPDWTFLRRKGDARARIVAEANSGRYELAVLSAHRRRFAADYVLGSTAERVLRHAALPLLAVPSGRARARLVPRLRRLASARLY
ncbi:MAG: universal stress protein [Elusimicrobiota bacterium]|nr:universal stress protein [Elusimicrobiota bacterium]